MLEEPNSTTSKSALVKQQSELKRKNLSLLQQRQHNFSFGNAGETKAIRFLKSKEYRIVDRNVRFKNYEVDIIAYDTVNQELVFVEVKTRSSDESGHASMAVTSKKRAAMNQVAKIYLQNHTFHCDYRFDTITIIQDSIEHFENITWNG